MIGLTAGFALSAWAGARRTDTALERLRVQTNAADAIAFPSQVGVSHPHWNRLRARPEVKTVAVWDLLFGVYNGHEPAVIFGSADGTYLGKVEKPVVVKGRMFNPHSPNEVVVDEDAVNQVPPVGGTFTYRFYNAKQVDETGPPHGPTVTMHVVGVVKEVAAVRLRVRRTGTGITWLHSPLRIPDKRGRECRHRASSRGSRHGEVAT